MELFSIVFSIPVAFVASATYSWLLIKWGTRIPRLSRILFWISVLLLAWFIIESLLLATFGAVAVRKFIGPAFYVAHLVLFLLGTPALANVLIIPNNNRFISRWYIAAILCTVFALILILLQYSVSEALYGINGNDGPFSQNDI